MTQPQSSSSNGTHGWGSNTTSPMQVSPLMSALQLLMMQMMWQTLPDVLKKANDASLNWKHDWPRLPENAPPETLEQACRQAWQARMQGFLRGVNYYQTSITPRTAWFEEWPDIVWQQGSCKIYAYGPADGKPLVMVPSMINRSYILDLYPNRSAVRALADDGYRVFLFDWGVPGAPEKTMDVAAYIEQRLVPALYYLHQEAGQALTLAGYCMGGVMVLGAMAILHPQVVQSLALLATPWDFDSEVGQSLRLEPEACVLLEEVLWHWDEVPAWFLPPIFYRQDAWLFLKKYRALPEMEDAEAQQAHMALEYWLNDGVPLTVPVARDCLLHWAHGNDLMHRRWKVGGHIITPEIAKEKPIFMAIPMRDRVVPPASAQPLVDALPHAEVIRPDVGHVRMMMDQCSQSHFLSDFTSWLSRVA
jgi:polyhydroxyalkanoate synthase